MCCHDDDEPYVPNEYTVELPMTAWRKLNMGVPIDEVRDPLLTERDKTHGSFANTAQKAQALKQTLAFNELSRLEIHNESLDMIATKLARIICGQPMTKDHWLDIAGYAKLGAEACE